MPGLFWPMKRGHAVTSGFGARWGTTHWGTDFGWNGGSANMPVYAVKDGTVQAAGPANGFGFWVRVDHPASVGGGHTVYGHIVPEVQVGQQVVAGQRIARIHPTKGWASNGNVDPHLHLEWHRYGYASPGRDRLDPMSMLGGASFPDEPLSSPPAPAPVPQSPTSELWQFSLEQFVGEVRQ